MYAQDIRKLLKQNGIKTTIYQNISEEDDLIIAFGGSFNDDCKVQWSYCPETSKIDLLILSYGYGEKMPHRSSPEAREGIIWCDNEDSAVKAIKSLSELYNE